MAEVDRFLQFVADQGGSDLHLSAGAKPQVRVHGTIKALNVKASGPGDTERLLREIMPERNLKAFEEFSDTDFAYELASVGRFRVNVFVDRCGMGAVFRLIPAGIMSPEELMLPEPARRLCQLPKGLVLVTGPTGSGKSTTLATLVDIINQTRKGHIITIEDPIEFVHQNKGCIINQREVHSHTKSFHAALRAALREDPDVILVGEMRDLETTQVAIEMAETGHLVFGTLHTTTAASTVDRLIDQFPHNMQQQIRTMLSVSLRGVVAQTLLRRKDGAGRVAAYEILVVTPAVANLIRETKTFQIPSAMETGARYGMVLMNDAMLKLVMDGLVDAKEVLGKAIDKDDMARKLQVAGIAAE